MDSHSKGEENSLVSEKENFNNLRNEYHSYMPNQSLQTLLHKENGEKWDINAPFQLSHFNPVKDLDLLE